MYAIPFFPAKSAHDLHGRGTCRSYSFSDGLSLSSNFSNVTTIANPMGIKGLRFKPLQANLRVWRADEKLNVKVLGRAQVRAC